MTTFNLVLAAPQPLVYDDTKVVVAHFIVGNTYNYSVDNWTTDFALASSKGIDGFALNVGSESWQFDRVTDAYAAASTFKTAAFKLFLSFDMTSLPCSTAEDATALHQYIQAYASHPSQLMISGRALVSTFAGQGCTFGLESVDEGWGFAIRKQGLPMVHFVPAFFVSDPEALEDLTMIDGAFNWRACWPEGNSDITFDPDDVWIEHLGKRDYMAGISPWFFTHYDKSSYDKNFVLRGDDWLVSRRWELLVKNRDKITLTQIVTWNDFGESSYVGPVEGVQPQSQAWTNGYDNHQNWLDLMSYFIEAFKTGAYPVIMEDRLFMWAKLFPTAAMTPDPVGRPENAEYLSDTLWAMVFLIAPASVTLTCGPSSTTMFLPSGVTRLALPLVADCAVEGMIRRAGVESVHARPEGFEFSARPQAYNFNAFVFESWSPSRWVTV
ncbi:glycoside hydrolase family 71 protein [Phlebopus sp. FC_14]|nr:glycoside hydrolase family 71 protein [Phlebopus sp. FC_14]